MFTVRTLVLVAAALLLAAVTFPHPAWAKEPPAPTVEATLKKFVDAHETSGAVALAHELGQPPAIAVVGQADLASGTAMQADTLFGIMSMTKPITATALMILVDEGKVALDDPVEKYIPAFADAKAASGAPVRGLTIRHLLTHTSGLGGDQGCHDSLAATAETLAKYPFDFQPGERWQYGPSLNVVGRIVEIVSGQPFDEFVRARILEPLAMHDTTFAPTTAQRARLAALYKKSADGKSLELAERWSGAGEPGCVPNPSGGLFSTVADLDRFYQMILNGGQLEGKRILSADAVQQMTTVQTGELETGFTPGNGWGLGWCVFREPQGVTGMLSPGSFGHGGAYGTEASLDPVKKRIYILMIQRSDLGNTDASDIRKEFQQAAADAFGAAGK